MDFTSLSDNGGRRSGSGRRSTLDSLYADLDYKGVEKRRSEDRRSGIDRRQHARLKVAAAN